MEDSLVILNVVLIYGYIGAAVTLVFVTIGIGRIDSGARGLQPLFRIIVIPGTVVLWPLVLTRMIRSFRTATEA